MKRIDSRKPNQLRNIQIERNYLKHPYGSVLISFGDTKVICTASVEQSVPPFLRGTGSGWVTAEYSMLPGSTSDRVRREVTRGKQSGRTNEIQRLIGRSLRAVTDLDALGECSITIDADVIQADGGTRTAAITGGMIVLWDAVQRLLKENKLDQNPIQEWLAAVSVGVWKNQPILDLCYHEDSDAQVDMNVVMTESGRFIEIQGTAEQEPFADDQLSDMIRLAKSGITELIGMGQNA